MDVARPFLLRPAPEPLTGGQVDPEVKALLERSAPVAGVGPQESRLLRLALGAEGYPDGAMLRALRDELTLDDALALEAVSLRRRDEVAELSRIARAQAERDAKRNAGVG